MVEYHFRSSEGPPVGPIGVDEFRQRQEAGEVNDETMVWRSGMLNWMSYAALRADEERATVARTTQPPARPAKAAATTVPVRAKGILPCGMCGQEWPESLLTVEDGQQICGNCVNRKKKEMKDGVKVRPSTGKGAWACIILAVVCAGCLYYKVSHYGIGPPMKAKELTEAAKYGR